ncbi:pyridoxamine 5'-phosphate oxidase family protein [Streptomyces sp. NPDC058258]|uniref:pyridoxamine 5'-phosphate oxidase family protein n=1 Tax=Streptomyces sp. NPDC058258 TaxID=3346410 RepID=UPI0036E1CF77
MSRTDESGAGARSALRGHNASRIRPGGPHVHIRTRRRAGCPLRRRGATAGSWPAAESLLTGADIYWLSTVRPDGRPHVTPLIGVWSQSALYFSTGASERKGLNDALDGAPPRAGVDLDAGTAVVRRKPES